MPFFSDSGPNGFEPKRKFRFLVTFTSLSNLTFMVKSVNKPAYTMTPKEHNVLNHVFKFPGVVKWNDIKCTFIDAVEPNVGSKFYNVLLNSGYVPPTSEGALVTGITKVGVTDTIGSVIIKQLDGGGMIMPTDPGELVLGPDSTNVVEEWELKNAFIKGVSFGEGLDYSSEDIVEVSVDLVYDYAVINPGAVGVLAV